MPIKMLLLFILSAPCAQISFAKIWRVNNNGGGGGDFTTAQAAHDGATPGDTIHLEPSPNSYGTLLTIKTLVWLSTGAFPDIHPNEQYSQTPGKINALYIYGPSENSVFSVYVEGLVNVHAAKVRLERCYITGAVTIQFNGNYGSQYIPNNVVIINCYGLSYLYLYEGTNHFVTNNIFQNDLIGGAAASGIIQNNVFNAVTATTATIYNCTLQNNIFNKTLSGSTFTNCVVQYNMSGLGGVLPAGNFNQNNVAMANVFVNNSGTTDAAFVLKANSPAIGAGAAGANMGAFGGTTPFKLALQPAIPAIYKITAPFVPAGNTMNVTFSTKSNN